MGNVGLLSMHVFFKYPKIQGTSCRVATFLMVFFGGDGGAWNTPKTAPRGWHQRLASTVPPKATLSSRVRSDHECHWKTQIWEEQGAR